MWRLAPVCEGTYIPCISVFSTFVFHIFVVLVLKSIQDPMIRKKLPLIDELELAGKNLGIFTHIVNSVAEYSMTIRLHMYTVRF